MHTLSAPLAARVRRLATTVACAGAAILAASNAAHAQSTPPTATLRFDEAGALAFTGPYGSPDVGRLKATFLSLPGNASANTPIDAFCIDILHEVTFDPNGWNVYLTNLGDSSISYTRQGTRSFNPGPDALTRYRKAAWLVDQYSKVSTLTDTAGIQGAMWLQFEPTLAPYDYATAGEAQAVATWEAAADAFAGSANFATYDWRRFTVLTDVNSAGIGDDYHGMQELITESPITATPEPTTVALLGVSLVGTGLVARRRASRNA
ncbi:hypothetical protein tb265_43830 [Gemmatimonadetes bacterium T265]|nr:hypothetical protein tb265_43830 [Gemmatimonadetes bacterium T265]